MPRSVMVLVNGTAGSAAGTRARGLFEPLAGIVRVSYLYRDTSKISSLKRFLRAALTERPDLVYVVDTAISGAGAAILARLLRRQKFLMDTGDLGYELAELTANPGWPGRKIIGVVEWTALRLAESVVVRGSFHKPMLEAAGLRHVTVIRDGIHPAQSFPRDVMALRREWGWEDFLCVGLMGSLRWVPRLQMCYGWDLMEAMGMLDPALPVRALIVGDGDGLPHLQRRAAELGLGDRVRFAGRVSMEEVPTYTSLMDVALSTQTNNRVGQVRTTGKLPEYMAAGCYVLATDVGEARLLLPPEMRLPYDGVKDAAHPARLAKKITELAAVGRDRVHQAAMPLVERAHRELDYGHLSAQLEAVLRLLLGHPERAREAAFADPL